MKLLLSALFAVFAFSCAHQPMVTQSAAQPVKTNVERSVANYDRVLQLRVNSAITGFDNEAPIQNLALVYAKEEVQYKGSKFAGYFQMKAPPKTAGILKPGRIFYAKLGYCKIFQRFEKSPNYCDTPILHLYNSMADLKQNKEPVGTINSWSPGNPTTRYAETTEEYSDLIKTLFDIHTNGVTDIHSKGVNPNNGLKTQDL